jgi:hypothetical protein
LNSVGLKSNQAAQAHVESRARPRPRWHLYRKVLRVFTNRKQVLSLFIRVTDRLQKDPRTPIHSRLEVHDGDSAEDELR